VFLEQQISMISEGSCDTEYWSNDAENYIKYIEENCYLNSNFYSIFFIK